ncbi:MAG: aspartate 1-decarboxylase [Candidatus Omnitrophica bacterium]|nr:aspartate 1-decarboxylase [Candidatus Omnitrophota bacterium]
MLISFCKSKIAHATVTDAHLHYEGSITVDENLLKAVGIIPGEHVHVLNLSTGSRIETYAIAGKAGSGEICLNGPAARCGVVGDKVIILSYGFFTPAEAKKFKTKIIHVDAQNKIRR